MSDLVVNPEDQFSHVDAHLLSYIFNLLGVNGKRKHFDRKALLTSLIHEGMWVVQKPTGV